MENNKTKIRKNLEIIEHEVHLSWLRDLDKTTELLELRNILTGILESESIEDYFEKNESDFDYFIKKFSKETINNILRQHYIYGEDGDEIASEILLLYLRIFLKFLHNNNYMILWDSVKDIFDYSKAYYKGMGFNTASKIEANKRFKKQMPCEYFNENFLQQKESRFALVKPNEEIDVFIENKRQYHSNDKKIWTRGRIHEVTEKQFSVKTAEDHHAICFNKNSFEYAPCGSMTKDYEWRTNLKQWDVIDCQDRGRWFPATVMNVNEEIINGLKKVDYKIGFRIYPSHFPEWKNYTKFWPEKQLSKDSQGRTYFGDQEGYDETISSISKRLQIWGLNTSGANKFQENEGLSIDDYILFKECDDDKKLFVVGKSNSFSYYYAMLINNFAKLKGYEKLLNLLHKDNKEKINSELLYFIFFLIANSSNLFHKEYIKILAEIMKENVINYLNDLNQNDLRNVKKETIELITKVLRYYLSYSLSNEERNEVVENFGLSFSLKMLKTSLLDKRISAVKTIVDMIKSAKNQADKSLKVLKIIEEHKIFYEIYGPNSHIQLINKSKDLLEIMLQEDKLSSGEMEIIWNGTKKGDLEGKLTILKTLKEISSSLKEKHIKMLLENIYQSEPKVLINEEIDLIFDLATHPTQPDTDLEKCVKFFLFGLFSSKTDDVEKTGILIKKIFQISKMNKNLMTSIVKELITNLQNNKNAYLTLRLLGKFILEKDKEINSGQNDAEKAEADNNAVKDIFAEGIITEKEIIDLFIKNFKDFKANVKNLIDSKNWNKDIDNLPLDNFTYSDNIKARLRFFYILIIKNIWNSFEESLDFIFNIMINDSLSEKDSQEFYIWIKKFIEKNDDMEIERKIFELFNNKICNNSKKCQNLSIHAFESYLKLFLDINKQNRNLEYNYSGRDTIEISVLKLPDTLIGFEILWKIIFESFSVDIMNKGIEILHILYNNIQIENVENQSEVLLKKCIDLIEQTNSSEISADEKHNIITKCLHVLNLMIEESEKKGTARVKSHSGLIKNKIIKLKISSYIPKVDDCTIRVFGNTTVWDLKEIISKKVGVAVDFLKLRIEQYEVCETDNGKTVLEMNLSDEDEIKTLMNSIDSLIPQVDLVTKSGQAIPQVVNVFNEWYDNFSTDGKMLREDCARFVKQVTSARDDIAIDDHRVNFLFSTYDYNNEGFVPRDGFVNWYVEAARKPDKKSTVWENLKNMGYRNDLKRLDEPYELHNVDKSVLPRYNLSHNENFFNAIFKLQDSNENIAKEAFNFLCKITTNPSIYRNILNGKDNWKNLLDAKNIYKLIYSLQIIESFLEDIEIDFTGVDSFANEESILNLDSNNLEIEEMKQLKIQWMRNFVSNQGFSHLVQILDEKLSEYSKVKNDSENTLMNKICVQFLLKIIRIFYNSCLNRFDIYKEVNQIINSIKKLNLNEGQDNIEESSFPSIKRQTSNENNNMELEKEELFAYLDNDSNNLSRKESIKKENEEKEKMEFSLSRKKSAQLDTNLLEQIFAGDLGSSILQSLNSIQLIKNLIDLLMNFNLKDKILNEDADILENSFELLCALLSFSENSKEIEGLILNEKREEFSKLCLQGLLNKTLSIREKYCYSLIKLAKVLTHYKNFDLVSFLFFDLFKFINSIENYDPKNFGINSNQQNANSNNKNDNNNLNTTELFEFFSNLFEIYLSNKETFESLLKDDNSLSPKKFLDNLSKTISDDINNLNNVNLKNEIFLGYLKILSKVVENITEMKEEISTNFDLIQDIMTKILFKQSNKDLNNKLDKLNFINPEKFNDHKDNRNTNQQIRNSCFKFILSMLNNSIKNFEKFFQVNILDNNNDKEEKDEKEENQHQMSRFNFYNFNNTKNEDHVGLKNLGCICYMNSMLQQFFMVPTFRRAILQVDDGEKPVTDNPLNIDDNPFHQLQRMFSYLELSNREDYNPEGFCFSFKDWDGNPTNTSIQQDAQEFLSRFLDKIEFALKPTDYKYLMHSVFGGKSCSQLICEDGCGTSKNRYEDMFFLSLEVSNMKTIYDSLDKYISPEKIDDFNCETCKKKVTITKRNVLSDLPNTLIVHLQRIFYNYEIDRNEKINSKLEFPKVLNLKNYTIEEMARKNAAKHGNLNENNDNNNENNENKESQFENEEIYFRDNEYYEYHLVGVNIHIGSADAGHYFSYINTVRNGTESEMTYDPKNENHASSWLKFNDSRISKFTIAKLEEECFGGKLDSNESDQITWNFRSNFESIQSAYMLVYERRVKSPIKIIVNEKEANENNLISYKEEQEKSIKKNYDLMYHLGKNTENEIKQKIFNSVFYDNSRNEYYRYSPFFEIERKLPKRYYLEITEDNNQLEKHQNITDENSSNFFENVINLLDDAINKNKDQSEEICDRIVISFINFIFNILSNKDKEKLLKIAASKFLLLLGENKFRINIFMKYLIENQKNLQDSIFHESPEVSTTHITLMFNAIINAYRLNKENFMKYLNRKSDEEISKENIDDLSQNSGKLLEILLEFFPKLNPKLTNKSGPLCSLIKEIFSQSEELTKYLYDKEYIYIFITFLIGKESPCYEETLTKQGENWDKNRLSIQNPTPFIELVYNIFVSITNSEPNTDVDAKFSERDIKCIKHPSFLKLIYKSSEEIFCDLLIRLNQNNYAFTKLSCLEITKFIDDITGYDENEVFKLVRCILKILEIEDNHQVLRFNILLGYPQLMVEEPSYRSNKTLFGYNLISDNSGKFIEIRGLYNIKNTSSLMRKIYSIKYREKIIIEVFLMILNAARTNLYLLKYIRNFNSEDANSNDYINYGIQMINGKRGDNTYLDDLKNIVGHLNELLSNQMDKINIPGFNSFIGKYYHKEIKREIYELIYANEGIYIFKVDFHCSKHTDNNEEEENQDEDTFENKDDSYVVYNYDSKLGNEREFFKRIISGMQQSNKKYVMENKNTVKDHTHNLIRYVAFNGCSRDVNINFKIFLNNLNEENKRNEFIPNDTITTSVNSYSIKNLCVLGKIDTEKNWSWETDSTQPEASIEYDIDVEMLEFKSMNSNYYGYGQGQNRMYFNNQDNNSYGVGRQNSSGSGGNRYGGVSNMDNYYDEDDEFNQKRR